MFVSRRAPDLKLGQLPLPNQQVLVLIAGVNHGRPVLDVSLTPLPPESNPCNAGHGSRNSICLFWTGLSWVTLHLGQGKPPRPCHIRLQGSLATIRAPAVLLEDYRPQAILKFHRPSSLDYRACYGLPVIICIYVVKWAIFIKNNFLKALNHIIIDF